MNKLVHVTAWTVRAVKKSYTKKWLFLGLSGAVFLGTVAMLGRFGFLPNPPVNTPKIVLAASEVATTSTDSQPATPEFPEKIIIPSINLSVNVSNPITTNIDMLDQLLLQGAVRYPTSAELGETGNVVIFGHSSYLPIVGDEAYKTFDGIQKLSSGDVITLYSSDRIYTYAVRTVEKESANSAIIPLQVSGEELTLSTCDSFASKTDRFVVTADFVESHSLRV